MAGRILPYVLGGIKMGFFGLPAEWWECKECGIEWNEDNPPKCPECGSKKIEKTKED